MPVKMNHKDEILTATRELSNWPRTLRIYLEICAHCGNCKDACHVYRASPDKRRNPAWRAGRLSSFYKSQTSPLHRLLGRKQFTDQEIDQWARDFYECTACRRCAQYCPFGIDNSVITRRARSILHTLGKTPKKLLETQDISDRFGNDEGASKEALLDSLTFLEQEILEEKGVAVRFPVDQEADYLFVPPSSDIFSSPETLMGCAMFFHATGLNWTMCSQAFDGANFGLHTGDDAFTKRKSGLLNTACRTLKAKTLVMGECGHALRVAKKVLPSFLEATSLRDREHLRTGGPVHPRWRHQTGSFHEHHACHLSRSLQLHTDLQHRFRTATGPEGVRAELHRDGTERLRQLVLRRRRRLGSARR